MPSFFNRLILVFLLVSMISCDKKENKETILEGKVTVWVDETVFPVIEDQAMIFESQYDAKINLEPKSEAEIINALLVDSAQVAILSRDFTPQELKVFSNRKIIPKVTKFAVDGVALICNKKTGDTLVTLSDVVDFMKGKNVTAIKGLAFDNPNSSTLRYLSDLAGMKSNRAEIYSFHNNAEAIKYVSENDGIFGVIGLNWLSQPSPEMQPYLEKISVVRVKDKGDYIFPSQNNLGEGKYPLARDLVVANCQGFSGLGMGFASFVAGERGQRIVLKSGLLPARVPTRKIAIKK